jgi:hypothetical protein
MFDCSGWIGIEKWPTHSTVWAFCKDSWPAHVAQGRLWTLPRSAELHSSGSRNCIPQTRSQPRHARRQGRPGRVQLGDWLVCSRSLGPAGLSLAALRQSLSSPPRRLKLADDQSALQ